jgi:hypothetical protein
MATTVFCINGYYNTFSMNTGSKFVLFLLISIIGLGCSKKDFPAPSCRVDANYASNHQGAAACVIVMNDKLLAKQFTSGKYNLAHGEASQLRSAQCSAHEAMWEQTGFNVQVQNVVGLYSDGTWLFACQLEAGFDGSEKPFDAPDWSSPDVESIAFIDPFLIEHQHWQEPDRFISVRDAYVAQHNYLKQSQ